MVRVYTNHIALHRRRRSSGRDSPAERATTCLGRQALGGGIAILSPLPWGEGARRAGEGARAPPMTTSPKALVQAPFQPHSIQPLQHATPATPFTSGGKQSLRSLGQRNKNDRNPALRQARFFISPPRRNPAPPRRTHGCLAAFVRGTALMSRFAMTRGVVAEPGLILRQPCHRGA